MHSATLVGGSMLNIHESEYGDVADITEQSFEDRSDLTEGEKDAIRCYRDLEYPQNTWSITASDRRQKDCDLINSCLRDPKLKASLRPDERKLLKSLIIRLTRAINKSHPHKVLTVYKGVQDFPELEMFAVGKTVIDYAFNSFSTSIRTAKKYAGKNADDEFIYFMLELSKDSNALYIDAKEQEWLLQRGLAYTIYNVKHVNNRKFKKAIIYYLKI